MQHVRFGCVFQFHHAVITFITRLSKDQAGKTRHGNLLTQALPDSESSDNPRTSAHLNNGSGGIRTHSAQGTCFTDRGDSPTSTALPEHCFIAGVRVELTARKLRYDNLPGGSEGT